MSDGGLGFGAAWNELGPVVLWWLQRSAGLACCPLCAPLLLACRPFVQAGVGGGAFTLHLHRVGQLRGQLQADAVGVEEIDTFEDMVVVLAVFPALYPFLLSGIYFFTLLHGAAWILILTGWITGGYRPPEKQGNEQIKREKNPKRSGHGWRRKKAHRRRKSKKKRSRKEDSSTKKKNTAGNKTFEWKHCQISYDPSKQTYRMISDSPEKILLLKEDNVIGTLEQGECVHVERPVTLQIQGKEERLHLK